MKFKKPIACLAICLFLPAFTPPTAAYDPAKDNPYVRSNDSSEKKWYEFYKKDPPSSPYIRKPSGYWRSDKKKNQLVEGAEWFANNVKEVIVATAK